MATRITNQTLSKSSRAWMREHLDDPFVKKAQKEGNRARAAYKLLEIQEKYKMIKPGMTVVDLGAAPGSWSQIAGKLVGSNGFVIAWWSAGITSAVACKMALEMYENVELYYIDINKYF